MPWAAAMGSRCSVIKPTCTGQQRPLLRAGLWCPAPGTEGMGWSKGCFGQRRLGMGAGRGAGCSLAAAGQGWEGLAGWNHGSCLHPPCMSMSDVQGGNGLRLSAAPLMAMPHACGSQTGLFATSHREDCVRQGPGSCIPKACATRDEAVEARRVRRAHPPGEVSPAQVPFADHLEKQAPSPSQQLISPILPPLCGPGSPKRCIYSLQEGMQAQFQSPGAGDPTRASPARSCWDVQREDMGLLSAVTSCTVQGAKSPGTEQAV